MSRFFAGLIGLSLILVSLLGLAWWQEALTVSGVDENRGVIQYYIPYMIFSVILVIGAIQIRKAV